MIPSLSPAENLAVGCLSGAVEATVNMPIKTYKFCAQEGRALPTSLPGWFRGVAVQAGTVAPITAIQFCLNGFFQQVILSTKLNQCTQLSDTESLITALGAGALTSFLIGPVDLITIQQQKLHATPFRTLQYLVKNYGTMSLFRGIGPTMVREAMYTAGYLGVSPVITHHLMQKNAKSSSHENEYQYPFFGSSPLLARMAGASIAGTLAAIITNPADCTKTCVQSDMTGDIYPTARKTLLKMWKGELEGGIWRIWNGLGPRIVRFNGAFFICLSFQEIAIDWKTKGEKCDILDRELRFPRPDPV
ncbi:hypothetical protein HJC23_010760 [Cyclotella cryptica]|uniref:Mitochondrial carrier protein n=1 Tax=Cyclotella cryptica TaxID=29204 RepID=A0ABD3PV37_9STRA|eukprot:CCRYP_011104-RA/>CCRYP_011104-RA protein AED:0.43 eAED:1.00 QI:0/0/0/1/1/1/2/0/303